MAQFLDITGLEKVAQNINSKILIVYSIVTQPLPTFIKNSTAPTLSNVIMTTTGKLLAIDKNGTIWRYTSWYSNGVFKSSNHYGTASSEGVIPNNGSLIYCISTKRLYIYNNGLCEVLCESPDPIWTVVWKHGDNKKINEITPFKDFTGYITKIEKTSNDVTKNIIWRITILNNDGEMQQFTVDRGNHTVSDGVILDDGEQGSFCIELTPSTQNGLYTVSY